MADRHREKPLSLRLGPLRAWVEQEAERTGKPVRRLIIEALERSRPAVCPDCGEPAPPAPQGSPDRLIDRFALHVCRAQDAQRSYEAASAGSDRRLPPWSDLSEADRRNWQNVTETEARQARIRAGDTT